MVEPGRAAQKLQPARAARRSAVRAIWALAGAVAFAGAAVGSTWLIAPVLRGSYFLLPLAAAGLTALLLGVGPGILCALLCAATLNWMFEHVPLFARDAQYHELRIALFSAVSILFAWVSGSVRGAYRHVKQARLAAEDREQRLRGELEFKRAITESLGEGVCAVNAEGLISFVNPAAERMLGYAEAELLGEPLHDVLGCGRITGGRLPAERCRCVEVLRTGVPRRSASEVFKRRDGSRFPVTFTSTAIRRDGAVVGEVLAFQDTSEQRRAEWAERFLAQASHQLSLSIDFETTLARVARLAVPDLGDWCMVVLVDEAGKPRRIAVEAANPARTDAVRAMLGGYPIDLEAEHGAGRVLRTGEAELMPVVADFVKSDETAAETRIELIHRIGLRSFMAVPLRARDRVLGVIDFAIADSDRRFDREDLAVAEELARRCAIAIDNALLYREAQDAMDARQAVLAVVSHDLRTPLSAILVSSGIMTRHAPRGSEGETVRATAAAIDRSARRMQRLIDDLADIASIDAGRLTIARAPTGATALADEALETLAPLAEEKGLSLVLQVAPDAGEVACDRGRILQVVANLAVNAIKATPAGGSVRLHVVRRGGEVVFSVIDDGPGIPGADLPRVFERYWRSKGAGYAGTGLGLAIAKGIVEAHGGRIWAMSREGEGSVFSFALPALPVDALHPA